jgi:hypothetical protein
VKASVQAVNARVTGGVACIYCRGLESKAIEDGDEHDGCRAGGGNDSRVPRQGRNEVGGRHVLLEALEFTLRPSLGPLLLCTYSRDFLALATGFY